MKPNSHATRSPLHKALALCACALINTIGHAASAASAATPPASAPNGHAYRCKQANGTMAYSQLPCSPQAELIKASDPRTEAQLRQALISDKEDDKLAAQMARARRHEERVAADARARERHAQAPAVVSSSSYRRHRYKHVNAFAAQPPTATTGAAAAKPAAAK